jgi:hypothetical protein
MIRADVEGCGCGGFATILEVDAPVEDGMLGGILGGTEESELSVACDLFFFFAIVKEFQVELFECSSDVTDDILFIEICKLV